MVTSQLSNSAKKPGYRLILASVVFLVCTLHQFTSPVSEFLNDVSTVARLSSMYDFPSISLNSLKKSQQQKQEILVRLREQGLTSQHLPQRNVSRNLCGAVPRTSPKTDRFPEVLATNHGEQCRPNAILYVVQKGNHSSYGRDSTALFFKSLDTVYQNYLSINGHADNVDMLIFHSGEYNQEDLDFMDGRYNHSVHFKLVNLNDTDYWTIPETVRFDNTSLWRHSSLFSIGYRHMMRWYSLKLYDFARDYGTEEGGCGYNYLMRMDEDSLLLSPVEYDLFDFMQSNNYSYAFRMCSFEMETELWGDYVDHILHCGMSLPPNIPYRPIQSELCGFYNNFFIIETKLMMQPDVQHFVQWIDALGNIYRDRYNDLRIQTSLVYAFVPPERIHRFLDWSYEHMTGSKNCPHWGAVQAGYLDPNATVHIAKMINTWNLKNKRCPVRRKGFLEADLSPTYSHLPPSAWFMDKFGKPREKFKWRTLAAGTVEKPDQKLFSG